MQKRKISGAYQIRVNGNFVVKIFPGPGKTVGITVNMQRIVKAHGSIFYQSGSLQLSEHGTKMLFYIPLQIHNNKPVFIITQIPLFNMLNLLVDNRSTNYKYDGNRKLADHQTLSDKNYSGSCLYFNPFQYFDRIKGRQIKRRITPRN